MFVISVSASCFLWGGLTFAVDLTDLFSSPGRSSLFPIDDNLLDDGHGNQGVPGVLGSPNCYPHQNGERIERFSRKVFVGGLPPDIDEGEDNITVFQDCIILLTFTFLLHQPSFFLFTSLLFLSPLYLRWNNLKLSPFWSPGGGLAPQSREQILLST